MKNKKRTKSVTKNRKPRKKSKKSKIKSGVRKKSKKSKIKSGVRKKMCKKIKLHKKTIKSKGKRSNVMGGRVCVSQKHSYDCVIACLSMFIEKPYKYIKDTYFPNRNFNSDGFGVWKYETLYVLNNEGYKVRDIHPHLPDRKAIVTVPSLNFKGSYHAIFWDGITICDPNQSRNKKNKNIKIYTHEKFYNEPKKRKVIISIVK